MNIPFFGKTGQAGWESQRFLTPLDNLTTPDIRSTDCCDNFSNPEGVTETIKKIRPDVIVNAMAHAVVDKIGSEAGFA